MPHTVTLVSQQESFTAVGGESILAAAKQQDLNLPHSCQSGICGQCKARLLKGKTGVWQPHFEMALSKQEEQNGYILLCCSTAESDLEVEMPGYGGADALPVKTVPSRVANIEYQADTAIVSLDLPKTASFAFHAGQYIDILLKGGAARSYSLASHPNHPERLELHIRHHPGGLFSQMLFSDHPQIIEKSILRIRGPLGNAAPLDADLPLIILATGTGFAPVQSLLLQFIDKHPSQRIHLYWGGRHLEDLYRFAEVEEWISRLPHASFTPVLSRPDDNWRGARGYVQTHAAADYPDMAQICVYACGSAAMIESAYDLFSTHHQLAAEHFFSDVFTPA